VSESAEKRRFDRLSDVERRERPHNVRALTVLSRINFDTEADAVSVDAPSRDDLLAVVRAIEKLQRPATRRG
jgi:hypothetical protein